jgi:hypothetical protein
MKPIPVTIIISLLLIASGCNARRLATNEIAGRIVSVLDTQYEKNLKSKPSKNANVVQYCLSASASVTAAVKTTEYMLNGYKISVQGDTAGEEVATGIGTLQTHLKDCAYVRCRSMTGVDVTTLRNLAGALGINTGKEPSDDSCNKYEKLSGEIRKMIAK